MRFYVLLIIILWPTDLHSLRPGVVLVSYNVELLGHRSRPKIRAVARALSSLRKEIEKQCQPCTILVALQEVYSPDGLKEMSSKWWWNSFSRTAFLAFSQDPIIAKRLADTSWEAKLRPILALELELPWGDKMIVGNVHWPSQRWSFKTRYQAWVRTQAFLKKKGSVALGDFNLKEHEREKLKGHFRVPKEGTYYYAKAKTWHKFDLLIGDFDAKAIRYDPRFLSTVVIGRRGPEWVPKRFHQQTGEGTSDHYPVYWPKLLEAY